METTFMTIHNTSLEANILWASESIVDILGFQPEEVFGRSCFDYFHPEHVENAKKIHARGLRMDKAAVLQYADIRNRDGEWIKCECVFTVVYDVLVACTSIYKNDAKAERRAEDAPTIRRLFASPPRDPRYHMLEHLSSKFRTPPQESQREPRAALILNRFSRTLTVMYATDAVARILGVTPDQLKDKSFYECMQENCLPEAIRCLESAKANDSIAYLRFRRRDPRREEDFDQEMREASQSSDSEDGGVVLDAPMDVDSNNHSQGAVVSGSSRHSGNGGSPASAPTSLRSDNPRTNSDDSTDLENDATHAIFDHEQGSRSSTSSVSIVSPEERLRHRRNPSPRVPDESYEIEAVVSCTSDGLVVVLRRARPMVPSIQRPAQALQYENGLFAAPWGVNPIRPHLYQPNPHVPFHHGLQAPQLPVGEPPLDGFMNSIREVAVFAWSLTGINGNIASYAHGIPRGESQPPGGLPVWDPHAQPSPQYTPPENQAARKWAQWVGKSNEPSDGKDVLYQHNFGGAGMGSNYSAPMRDVASPAYTYQPQPGHTQGQVGPPIWSPAPPPAAENNPQVLQAQVPESTTIGPFGNPNVWHQGNN